MIRPCAHTLPSVSPTGRSHGLDLGCSEGSRGRGRDAPRGGREQGPAEQSKGSHDHSRFPNPEEPYKTLPSSCLTPLPYQQKGLTALNSSAYNGHDKCTDLLIKAGARLDLKDNWETTALALAKEENHPKCVALLEAANAP